MDERIKIRRTDEPDIAYWEANPVLRFGYNVKEFRVDTRNRKFVLTPITWDGDELPSVDVTDCYEQFLREQR